MKKEYVLEKLGCAHCAGQMENELNKLPKIKSARIDFASARLIVEAEEFDGLKEKMQSVCKNIEPDMVIIDKKSADKQEAMGSWRRKAQIVLGIFAYVLALSNLIAPVYNQILFFLAYILLGSEIIWKALYNLAKREYLDENFLMTIATAGAFIIGDSPEAVGVILFYRIGEYLERHAVAKTRKRIIETVDLRPETVRLAVDDFIKIIPIREAKVGDIIHLRPGDRVPLDGEVIYGESRVDTSPVTGEPVPVRLFPGKSVMSGSLNLSGPLQIKIEKELADSMTSRILASVEDALANKPRLDRLITRFSRVYTPLVVAAAAATAIIPGYLTGQWEYWFYTALTFLVISCPCALVLSVPLTFFAGIGAASKQAILFKSGSALEMLGKIKAVIMDKTGTLTEGNFVVQQIKAAEGVSPEALLAISAGLESTSSHPIGTSIIDYALARDVKFEKPIKVEEITGEGLVGVVGDKKVLCGNLKLLNRFNVKTDNISEESLGTEVFVAVDGKYWGRLILADTIKSDTKEAVDAVREQGIYTAVLTGDTKEGADIIAKSINFDYISAKLLPEEKLAELAAIRDRYGVVMYVGDGINDAPALAAADVGAAMSRGVDAATEIADVVFMTKHVSAIPLSIKIARKTLGIAKQNIIFALAVKLLVMLMGLAGAASMWMAVFADSGVALLCVANALRLLKNPA